MNDRLKIIVFIGIIICIIIGFLFLLEKRSASYTDTTQIEKAAVSQGQKVMLAYYADLSLSKRADPTDAYIRPWAEEAPTTTLNPPVAA